LILDKAVDSWRVAGDAWQTEIVLLDQQIENLAEIRSLWRHRYELATMKVDAAKLDQWLKDLDEFLDQLKDSSRSLDHRRDIVHEQQRVVQRDAREESNADAAKLDQFENARLQELRDLSETSLNEIKSTERSLGRFRKELKSKIEEASGMGTGIAGTLRAIMSYKVVEDDDQSVTVGRLLVLLAYIVGGVLLAYLLSMVLGRRLLPHLGIQRGTAAALKSIVFYTMCVVFGVVAFKLLNIPLAAFAFLGGAAAIAIGFGSQDIMNNFMSGIILLVEQPIRVGDVVAVEDVQGVVMHIGLRSTRLQTDLNHELIVPNKTLIDEEVTNLTLTDNFVQTFVAIGVERDVEVQKAKLDMLRVAFSHPLVIKSPRPFVLLKEVDTYWMTFEVHFSLEHGSFMRCATVQSEILEQISDMFKPPTTETGGDAASVDSSSARTAAAAPSPAEIQKSNAAVLRTLKHARAAMNIKA